MRDDGHTLRAGLLPLDAEQARALRDAARAGANLPVDWENVAEEIESLGRSDRREITSRLATIM